MNLEELRDYCLAKPKTTEGTPFGEDTLVFKVMDKMFLLTSISSDELRFNVKCEPELALELREKYESVIPGYHMSKKHWNTIIATGELSDTFLIEQINNSYDLVVSSLPKKLQKEITS